MIRRLRKLSFPIRAGICLFAGLCIVLSGFLVYNGFIRAVQEALVPQTTEIRLPAQ